VKKFLIDTIESASSDCGSEAMKLLSKREQGDEGRTALPFRRVRGVFRADPHPDPKAELFRRDTALKEELPEERQSRFLSFVLGDAVYAGLLIFAG
jgi:hypothetical protein